MVRSRRRGFLERVLLNPFSFLRPYRCPLCGYRRLRSSRHPSRLGVLLLFLTIALGIYLVQFIWLLSTKAPEHPGAGYEPKDMERFHYSGQ
jgi:hypothetical protein